METQTRIPEFMQVALFAALIILLAATPLLQYIPLEYAREALVHIPVIIGSLVLGPKKGALLGLVFALTGFAAATVDSGTNILILTPLGASGELHEKAGTVAACFLPRILVGVIPYYVYLGMGFITKNQILSLALAGLLGSLINTPLISDLVYGFFRNITLAVSEMNLERVQSFLFSLLKSHELSEAAIAAVLVSLICRILLKFK